MNDIVKIAEILAAFHTDMDADHIQAARIQESRIESMLRGYIENTGKQYSFGGIVNLLTTIARVMEEKSQLEGDDFEKAAQFIEDCADLCDLKYQTEN